MELAHAFVKRHVQLWGLLLLLLLLLL